MEKKETALLGIEALMALEPVSCRYTDISILALKLLRCLTGYFSTLKMDEITLSEGACSWSTYAPSRKVAVSSPDESLDSLIFLIFPAASICEPII
jgi:hypothetical protein